MSMTRKKAIRKKKSRKDQKEATRSHLLLVARREFGKRGFNQVDIADICRAGKFTHGALYHHFPSKTALFAAVVAQVFSEVAESVRRAVKKASNNSAVSAACEAYLDACSDPEVQIILFKDAPHVLSQTDFYEIDNAVNAPLVTGLLQSWIDAGIFKPVDVPLAARLLGAAFAEAGAAIAEADDPKVIRLKASRILHGWIKFFMKGRKLDKN